MSRFRAQAVVAFLRREHAGSRIPNVSAGEKLAALTYADTCVACHKISGEGGTLGPDLTRVATRREAASIKAVIEDAPRVFGETAMPVFKTKLNAAQIDALASYLSWRRLTPIK
jgi:mono/diheme cytochrome c family protein